MESTNDFGIHAQMRFHRGEPIYALFKRRLRLSSWQATLILVVVLNIPVLVAVQYHGAWLSTPDRVGLLRDFSWMFQQLCAVPAIVLFHFWLPEGIQDVVNGLLRNKTIVLQSPREDSRKRLRKSIQSLTRCTSLWIWPVLCFCAALGLQLLVNAPVQRTYMTWQSAGPFVFWYSVFSYTVIYYITALVIGKYILVVLWINRLFKEIEKS